MLKNLIPLLLILSISCKSERSTPVESKNNATEISDLVSVEEYKPNPDEVVLSVNLISKSTSRDGWIAEVEVKRQIKSGFSYKNRLRPGSTIKLSSSTDLPDGEFYCSADYEVEPGGGSYTLNKLLKK